MTEIIQWRVSQNYMTRSGADNIIIVRHIWVLKYLGSAARLGKLTIFSVLALSFKHQRPAFQRIRRPSGRIEPG